MQLSSDALGEFSEFLEDSKLRYISYNSPGIIRRKLGSGFGYFNAQGKITAQAVLERIHDLAIPPAWTNVWICPSPSGYLQATGLDNKNRRQYIYHPKWKELSSQNKFGRLPKFAKSLPDIRKKVDKHIVGSTLDQDRVLATVVWLLEHTFIRVGNEEYARDNQSFGVTTLRNRHVEVWGKKVKFEFKGKSGIEHSVEVVHPRIAKVIKQCVELPGYEIFQYLDEEGARHLIDSANVNEYLKQISGEDITAKDFRTWGGTTLAATTLNKMGFYETETEAKKNIAETICIVSKHLRNTTSVCREYYIHPVIVKLYMRKLFIPQYRSFLNSPKRVPGLLKEEFAVLTLLEKYPQAI
jgi:DNA topoisomerase I